MKKGGCLRYLLWGILLGGMLGLLLYSCSGTAPEPEKISVLRLYTAMKEERVEKLEVDLKTRLVRGRYKDGPKDMDWHFESYVVSMDELEKIAIQNKVEIIVKPAESSSGIGSAIMPIIWIILIIVFFYYTFRMMRQSKGDDFKKISKLDNIDSKLNQPRVTFQDIAGCDEAKEEVQEVIDFLKNPGKFCELGARLPKGLLLVGPPGTGKTLMARAVAGEAMVPFFAVSGSEFVEMFVGVGASRVRDLFNKAKKSAPCVVLIDEIDAAAGKRGASFFTHDEGGQTLNQLLAEMDGFNINQGIIVIGATNRPEILDPALLRPGRFDRQVVMPLPDIKGREAILKVHCQNKPLSLEVDLEEIARGTPGFSGADLANLANEAAIFAGRQKHILIKGSDFQEALDKILMGPARKLLISPEEREVIAVHESGHVLAAKYIEGADPIHKVTVIPRGEALGLTRMLPKADRRIYTRKYLFAQLVILMGGRAAEMIRFDSRSSGAASDLMHATELSRRMICELGMSERIGTIVLLRRSNYLNAPMDTTIDCSDETKQKIDEEINLLLKQAYEKAESIIKDHDDQLKILTKALMEKETLDKEQIEEMLNI